MRDDIKARPRSLDAIGLVESIRISAVILLMLALSMVATFL